ncbi:Transcriptional regulator GlxA family, contains an amidase domain and an AraC-type DNA-binding HTH domain [Microbulbifer donghaiensis]|uniref:Transcriptional regulator GlxA family, contains an amidase domain and an AraC-type DNA-binding HTH domain n=1 Tax=Microbulbifer donghaiensis TaxID=494016 RepID=A0A1M4WCM2_9GAMM|nr:helix-turn-helix domain-containing protein [Microbulbifer donghaiensis]SHE78813.1 Transcriptional regulator GlxA family, contains an amidase domain and an AraC-type DNA-binding HTH domain [Microbulbifer donghaiensis]
MSQRPADSVVILLLPGFSVASLGVLSERFTADRGRAPLICSFYDEAVPAEHGVQVRAQMLPRQVEPTDRTLVVCGGRQGSPLEPSQRALLQRIGVRSGQLIGIGSGVIALAQAGLLGGHHCSAPAELGAELQRLEPQLLPSPSQFTGDGRIWTCCNEAALGVMLNALFSYRCENGRAGGGRSRGEVEDCSILLDAQILMRNNLTEPLTTAEIAFYLGVTSKKLERIFRRFAGQLPARFYIDLRLSAARQLLHHSNCSIEEIGNRCGFSSASHFSRAFRNHFGRPPRAERQRFTAVPEAVPASGPTNINLLAG